MVTSRKIMFQYVNTIPSLGIVRQQILGMSKEKLCNFLALVKSNFKRLESLIFEYNSIALWQLSAQSMS